MPNWQVGQRSIEWLDKYQVPYTVDENNLLFILESTDQMDVTSQIAFCLSREALVRALSKYTPEVAEDKLREFVENWKKRPVLELGNREWLSIWTETLSV